MVRATRELPEAITPSFEAYKKYAEALKITQPGSTGTNNLSVMRGLLGEAARLDPEFPLPWTALYSMWWNCGMMDSARAAYEEAMRRSNRFTEGERLYFQATVQSTLLDDPHGACNRFDTLIHLHPNVLRYHANRAANLMTLGRSEQAERAFARMEALSPFGLPNAVLVNRFRCLLDLGRLADAAEVDKKLPWRTFDPVMLAMAAADWSRAESLATRLLEDRRFGQHGRTALAALAANRGQLKLAASQLVLGEWFDEDFTMRLALELWGMKVSVPAPEAPGDTGDLVCDGLMAALVCDTMTVLRILTEVARQPDSKSFSLAGDIRTLEAWSASCAGDWTKVVDLLGKLAIAGDYLFTGRLPVRCLIARAHEALGDLEAAVAAWEQVLSIAGSGGFPTDLLLNRPILFPVAHRQLVLLYSRLGRLEEARRHWVILQQTVTNPDPELRPALKEAERALEEAEAQSAL